VIKQFFSDAIEAMRYFSRLQKGVKPKQIPVYVLKPAYYNTIEGSYLSSCDRKINMIANAAFDSMSFEQQKAMEGDLADGEYIERAKLWLEALRQTTAECKEQHAAMVSILSRYRQIKHMHENQPREAVS